MDAYTTVDLINTNKKKCKEFTRGVTKLGSVLRQGIYKEETFILGTEGLRDRQQLEKKRLFQKRGVVRLQAQKYPDSFWEIKGKGAWNRA